MKTRKIWMTRSDMEKLRALIEIYRDNNLREGEGSVKFVLNYY